VLLQKGAAVTEEALVEVPRKYWGEIPTDHEGRIQAMLKDLEDLVRSREEHFRDKIEKLAKGDELPPGVIKMVKVYIAIKRKLQVGDKMAGRHGNKGVVSRILPEEDMPYLADGSPVDIVLNPLGVPSRMNVGQILEVHLGLGRPRARPAAAPHGGAKRGAAEIKQKLKDIYKGDRANEIIVEKMSDEDAVSSPRKRPQRRLHGLSGLRRRLRGGHQGRAGARGPPAERSDDPLRWSDGRGLRPGRDVGVMYMLKLHHLVDDKIHARSIGPYSLVTQQPLGGKAQFGGQRLGEMEVWAMEAYGAAYALQEFLTVKSDDVMGRTRMYEAIVKGEYTLEAGLPESFNVLIKELQALCLNVELVETGSAAGLSRRRRSDPCVTSSASSRSPRTRSRSPRSGSPSRLRRRSGSGRTARSRSPRPSTTAPSSPSGTACSARRSSGP
jgi:DNA-directed RNA polymerase subunit beta